MQILEGCFDAEVSVPGLQTPEVFSIAWLEAFFESNLPSD